MGQILIVDDEPHLRRILISNLKQEHHEVIEAAGRQRRAIRAQRADLRRSRSTRSEARWLTAK